MSPSIRRNDCRVNGISTGLLSGSRLTACSVAASHSRLSATPARSQSAVQGLYNPDRWRAPMIRQGNGFVRKVFLVVLTGLIIKLIYDMVVQLAQ